MARNAEIKARVDDLEAMSARAAALATEGPLVIEQDDTFFVCASGRLKLRDFGDGSGELIFYRRADQRGPKESSYLRSRTTTPAELRESLALACGRAGRVVKRRTVYLVGRTRVHLDRVAGLGDFVELEVVLRDDEPFAAGELEAKALMARLGIADDDLVAAAYVDLAAAIAPAPAPATAAITEANPTVDEMQARVARFASLRPTDDYVDAAIPGFERTTYRVLGTTPGAPLAAEGFHLNLVRCEPGKAAPLHSHLTQEVFVALSGRWEVFWGPRGERHVTLEPWDTIEIPPGLSRGFRNVAAEASVLMGMASGRDPGRIDWPAAVRAAAQAAGVELPTPGGDRRAEGAAR